jgi:hypothetical protein
VTERGLFCSRLAGHRQSAPLKAEVASERASGENAKAATVFGSCGPMAALFRRDVIGDSLPRLDSTAAAHATPCGYAALPRLCSRRLRRTSYCGAYSTRLCCLTFELTPTAEAGSVSLVRDDAPSAADQAYAACRSGSAVERGVRPHSRRARELLESDQAALQRLAMPPAATGKPGFGPRMPLARLLSRTRRRSTHRPGLVRPQVRPRGLHCRTGRSSESPEYGTRLLPSRRTCPHQRQTRSHSGAKRVLRVHDVFPSSPWWCSGLASGGQGAQNGLLCEA